MKTKFKCNAQDVLNRVNKYLQDMINNPRKYNAYGRPELRIDDVYEKLSIFDWWKEYLSISNLKSMQKFLHTAIQLGFTGYVCFKVGVAGCSHGMWAHKKETEDGYSPDGDTLYHSFRAGDNYWDAEIDGEWLHDTWEKRHPEDITGHLEFSLRDIKARLNEVA